AGDWGENLAVDHLVRKGYDVVARNWRAGRLGELDIVARDGDALVIVEVKTARGRAMGHPATWVTPPKQARIERLAEVFLAECVDRYEAVRFDVVTVDASVRPARIEHVVDAWRPTES
ncbi:MAG TPA: YraN family protein, partial [Firmicutes bacterium]|nr:YraN family protein [Bacillota bacterium]